MLASFARDGTNPHRELGDSSAATFIEPACRKILRGSTVVVRLEVQRQCRFLQTVMVVYLTRGQLLCETAAHRWMLSVSPVSRFLSRA